MPDSASEPKFTLKSESSTAQGRLDLPVGDVRDASKPQRRRKDSARLVWDSKPKRPPSPRDIEFQTAEVVIPNPARDAGTLPFTFRDGILHNEEIDRAKMNRLIWGDNLLVMQALLATGYEGKIDLIYIDPPFDSKSDYSYRIKLAAGEVVKQPSVIEQLAYRDTWEAGTDSYLDMLYPRVQLMRRLLSEQGTLWLHVGWNIAHYVRALLDEVFGRDHCVNQIIWKRQSAHSDIGQGSAHFGPIHDVILLYARGENPTWKMQYTPYDEDYIEKFYRHVEPKTGRKYQLGDLTAPGGATKGNPHYTIFGVTRYWRYSEERMKRLIEDGRIVQTTEDSVPRLKRYLDEMPGVPLQDIWTDVGVVQSQAGEHCGFGTQKPEKLIDRIVRQGTHEGALVADFFCGSGTTGAVAEKLGRRWIMSDLGKVGIQVTRGRLVQQDAKPFLIENIGNYQREMIYLTGGRIGEMQRIILKLYGATPHPTYKDLGVRKVNGGGAELVYVGYPDRPTTAKKVEEVARSAETLDGDGYARLVVLAWDYDYNFDTEWDARLKHAKRPLKIDVQRRMIPPDVYDYLKKARDEADIEKLAAKIQFHEKPYLKLAKPKLGKKDKDGKIEVTIGIERYVLLDLPVPEKEQEKLRAAMKDNFAILIDYWAIDWNYDGATFKSQWQAIRGNGKKASIVPTSVTQAIAAGKRSIAVRLVDVFGNDASAILTIGN